VEATPECHPLQEVRLYNLGNQLSSRCERTGNTQDLDAAIARSTAAVDGTPEDHPGRAGLLNNLGNISATDINELGICWTWKLLSLG